MFKANFKLSAPLGVFATSHYCHGKEIFAYLDCDVKKGLRWCVKVYRDAEMKDLIFEAKQEKFAFSGAAGYTITKAGEETPIATWVPVKRRLLNFFLQPTYKLVIDDKIVATAPGEAGYKLLIPKFIRRLAAHNVILEDGKKIGKMKRDLLLNMTFAFTYENDACEDETLSIACAVITALRMIQS